MKQILRFFIFTLLIFSALDIFAQNGNNVKIEILKGSFYRCSNDKDTTLEIKIVPNPTLTWTQVKLDWGDGTKVTILPGGVLTLSHNYSAINFTKNCYYPFGEDGFLIKVYADVKYSNGPPDNVTATLTFQNAPKAEFMITPTQPCIDQLMSITNKTCPANDPYMKYKWYINGIFKDSSDYKKPNYSITFSTGNVYNIKLDAKNNCGISSFNQNIQSYEKPIANIKPDSGFVTPIGNPALVCLGGGGTVKLDGAILSQNETTYK